MNFRDGGLDVSTIKPTLAFPQARSKDNCKWEATKLVHEQETQLK